jgi:uncharacterized protein with gpF-like domain
MPPNTWKAYPVINGVKKCYKCLNDYPIDQYNFKSGYMRHMCRACDIGTLEERVVKSRARYAREKESRKERMKERKKDPIYVNKRKEWNKKANHKTHSSGKWTEWYRKQSSELTDTYMMHILNRSLKGKGQYINRDMVDSETLDILRTSLKLKREIKQLKSLNQ